jgi:hypothetical protein
MAIPRDGCFLWGQSDPWHRSNPAMSAADDDAMDNAKGDCFPALKQNPSLSS